MVEKDIGKIKKNDNTEIVIRIDDFGGKPGVTIREFTTSDRYTGFTKSGTRISAEAFKDFKQMINSIDEKELASMQPEEPEQGNFDPSEEDMKVVKKPSKKKAQKTLE